MQSNLTLPFLFGTKVTSRFPGKLEMTVVVRGVFRLAPGVPVTPIADLAQLGLQGDIFGEGDDDRLGPLVHASDFADFKLKTDLLLHGTCHPGEGGTVPVCVARFSVGDWSKSLRVLGQRVWTDGLLDPISDPIPFASMPITYGNAFGGPGFGRNPAGKGYDTTELPTVENPAALIRSRRDTPEPGGFGPLSPNWPQRSGKLGADYGASWKKTRAPFYSADFDWSYFNSAPLDQQRVGYLRGDEELSFEFLHPETTRFAAKLPGLRPRVFVRRTDEHTAEVPMNLDTLVADLDEERVILLWRGLVEVHDDQLDDVRTIFIGSESLGEEKPAAHYLAELDALDKDPIGYLTDRLMPPEVKRLFEEAKATKAKADQDIAEAVARAKAQAVEPPLPKDPADRIAALLERNADNLKPEQATAAKEGAAKLKSALQDAQSKLPSLKEQAKGAVTPTSEGIHQRLTQAIVDGKARAAAVGFPTDRYDTATNQLMEARQQRLASAARLKAAGTPNPRDAADAEVLTSASADVVLPDVPTRGSLAAPALPEEPPGPRVNLMERDFSGRDMSGADLRGALLRKAKLVGTKLVGANLQGADLGEVDLEGADLTGADLTRANLSRVHARNAVFDGATIAQTLFDRGDFTGASLVGAVGAMAVFTNTTLRGARLAGIRLHKATFIEADIENADFTGAELDICCFVGVLAAATRFVQVRLNKTAFLRSAMVEASFYRASGEGCSWQGSTLDSADFRYARLRRAQLNKASLQGAKLGSSDFRGGRFERAMLADADFSKADLMSVSFCKAKLAATDFSGASLYDAKFLGATSTDKCNFDGANLTRAMWEQP